MERCIIFYNELGVKVDLIAEVINPFKMKNVHLQPVKTFTAIVALILLQVVTYSQDTAYSTSTTTASEQLWYLQPWVWIVGGAVLLLLLVALFSGGKKKNNNIRTDKVIITKTVTTESDVTE
ncbi:MAG: hypothetical protein ABIO05_09690 [Ferruginibacter sp.]